MAGYLDPDHGSRSKVKVLSMNLPNKKPENLTGINTMRGVFKAYVLSFLIVLSMMFQVYPV